MLTNFKGGKTDQFTVGVNKAWYEGWAEGLGFDLSYTYVDATEVHPGTSSVAASNFDATIVHTCLKYGKPAPIRDQLAPASRLTCTQPSSVPA